MTKLIPIGIDDFKKFSEMNLYYVDKTDAVRQIIEAGADAYLIVRPKRFGKTLSLSMLDAFFNIKYEGNTWFDGLKVSEYEPARVHKNAYPVIMLDFKDAKGSYDFFIETMKINIGSMFRTFYSDLEGKVDPCMMDAFEDYCKGIMDEEGIMNSLAFLSEVLFKAYQKKAIILIDEYDAPVFDFLGGHSIREIANIMRGMLYRALKGNRYLHFAVVTGEMHIAKVGFFPELDFFEGKDPSREEFDELFGFTDDDVRRLCDYFGHPEKYDGARDWYDGYHSLIVDVLYCPWSVLDYISK